MSRLDPSVEIADDIMRAEVYRRLLDYLADPSNAVIAYEIRQDEALRADLAAYRAYGAPELAWAMLLVCDIDDSLSGLPVGFSVRLPPLSVLHQVIREVRDGIRI